MRPKFPLYIFDFGYFFYLLFLCASGVSCKAVEIVFFNIFYFLISTCQNNLKILKNNLKKNKTNLKFHEIPPQTHISESIHVFLL